MAGGNSQASGNFGKTKTNFNEHTGATIISSTSNYDKFAENFERMQKGEVFVDKTETLFPLTIKVPAKIHKELSVSAALSSDTVEGLATKIFMTALT